MEYEFDLEKLFKCNKEGVAVLDGSTIQNVYSNSNIKLIGNIIDDIGEASAKVIFILFKLRLKD